ncbi:MAG: hypothetical protein AAGA16_12400, partial [Cyanobacteria bacterium P01_E01_bin.35]
MWKLFNRKTFLLIFVSLISTVIGSDTIVYRNKKTANTTVNNKYPFAVKPAAALQESTINTDEI